MGLGFRLITCSLIMGLTTILGDMEKASLDGQNGTLLLDTILIKPHWVSVLACECTLWAELGPCMG